MHFLPNSRLTRIACVAFCVAVLPGAASAQLFGKRDNQDSEMAVRLSTLEDQVRQLNGQVEQLTYQVKQLEDQLRRMSEDTEYRFQQLGQGGTGRSTVAAQQQVMQPQGTTQIQPHVMAQPQGGGTMAGGTMGGGAMGGGATTGMGTPPQTLGQVPGQPLDLSNALGGSQAAGSQGGTQPGFGQPVQQGGQQLAAAPSGDPKDMYDLSYGYILRGEFDTAEASFRQFLVQFPNDPLAGNAQYWLGESMFARGMYKDAADAFLKGYSNYPEGAKAPESLYKLGMSLKELGQGDAACSTFAEISKRYPRAPQAVLERARSEAQKSGC